MTTRSRAREYVSLVSVAGVLVGAVFTVRRFAEPIRAFINGHAFWGLFLYITLNIVDAVVAPGATLPLIPVAVRVWGHVVAALTTTAGWTAGSLIAFLIARRWGYPVVRKITSIERVRDRFDELAQDLDRVLVLGARHVLRVAADVGEDERSL